MKNQEKKKLNKAINIFIFILKATTKLVKKKS